MTICNQRWEAPRYDAPSSVEVVHVCMLGAGHEEDCKCGCGAMIVIPAAEPPYSCAGYVREAEGGTMVIVLDRDTSYYPPVGLKVRVIAR